ncbi:hypothetical protein K2173_008689 [Erythroxylum novogranatense]|uniref:3-ketoacyl-CoA synthase n=1 Tax=Erythroxylum novogranatense TaxID=1862640 RepID=A0AAV8SLT8_9ROSI|nr:hypothetical protein K2173_008689 [Erythroxylum novogranatense]
MSPPSSLLSQVLHSTFMGLLRLSSPISAIFSPESLKILSNFLFLYVVYRLIIRPYLFKPSPTYLVDFSCFKPPGFCRVPFSTFLEHVSIFESFDSESIAFMAKILMSSGQSEETYLPPCLQYIPPKTHHRDSIDEVEMVLFPVIEDLFSKTKVCPLDIDILIVNCSGFCPSPSLSSIVINKFAMREDTKSYNLSGMGCSAGCIAIDMAHSLLKIHKNSSALIVSTEILSNGWYSGQERAKLLINCLFRMGSAAILLTNRKEAKNSSKYKLVCSVRTQRAFQDDAYLSAFREEDSNGKLGVTLTKNLLQVAGQTLKSNITILGSQILPPLEKLLHCVSVLQHRFTEKPGKSAYVPDFKKVVQHFCLPTSGKGVIREIAKGLKLEDVEVEGALMTLHRFGNQSSSSLWYELAYMEAKERVRKGDKVWQLGMGSGPKCCSLVWECLKPIVGESKLGPWADCLHRYPRY